MSRYKTLRERVQELGYPSYSAYLKSDHWKDFRKRYWRSSRSKVCWCCGSSDHLQIHHTTYRRLGKERLTDVIALCESCHREVHDRLRQKGGLRLRTAASVLRAEKFRSGVNSGDKILTKKAWKGVEVKFVDPKTIR
jgi:phage terminase large subunit GpA-like protein